MYKRSLSLHTEYNTNINTDVLYQACQTQTSLQAAKATKTAEGAAKVPKVPQWATFHKF